MRLCIHLDIFGDPRWAYRHLPHLLPPRSTLKVFLLLGSIDTAECFVPAGISAELLQHLACRSASHLVPLLLRAAAPGRHGAGHGLQAGRDRLVKMDRHTVLLLERDEIVHIASLVLGHALFQAFGEVRTGQVVVCQIFAVHDCESIQNLLQSMIPLRIKGKIGSLLLSSPRRMLLENRVLLLLVASPRWPRDRK